MDFDAQLPLMDFGGNPYTLRHLVDYSERADGTVAGSTTALAKSSEPLAPGGQRAGYPQRPAGIERPSRLREVSDTGPLNRS
jgi:hypothetical protein